MKVLAILALAFALGGCGVAQQLVKPSPTIEADKGLSAPAAAAQKAIAKGYSTLAAAYGLVAENVGQEIMTKDEAKPILAKLDSYNTRLDKADNLRKAGVFGDAQSEADLINGLLLELNKQLAAKAKEKKNGS